MSTGPEKELEFDELEEQVGVPSGRPASEKLAHPTVKERAARGKDARTNCPRTSFAELDPPKRDPVALLEAQAPSRVPELVPIRYGRMLVSPFAFFRGGAAIMAHDIASAPRTDLAAQLCGDAHLANFGGFASPERDLVFDLNDFDETLAGPVRVGPEAPRGELRGRGPRSQLLRRRAPRGRPQHRRLLPSGDARSSRR